MRANIRECHPKFVDYQVQKHSSFGLQSDDEASFLQNASFLVQNEVSDNPVQVQGAQIVRFHFGQIHVAEQDIRIAVGVDLNAVILGKGHQFGWYDTARLEIDLKLISNKSIFFANKYFLTHSH